MENLTIKLLHERKSRRPHRKCDGNSGKLYAFTWNDEHGAYCFTTSSQEEADDLFNSQGRQMGSYFAPVITIGPATVRPKRVSAVLERELALRGITLPVDSPLDNEPVGEAVLAGWEKGFAAALAPVPTAVDPAVTPADPALTPAEPFPAVEAAAPVVESGTTVTPPPAKKKKADKSA